MKHQSWWFKTLFCVFLFPFIAQAGEDELYWGFNPEHFFEKVEEQLKGTKGYALIAYQDGKLLNEVYTGVAVTGHDKGGRDRLWSPHTLSLVGSISKAITTVGILKILEQNPDFHLDDPIARYLPKRWNPNSYFQKVTLRMLLTHQAGLPRGLPPGYHSLQELVENWDPQTDKGEGWIQDKVTEFTSCLSATMGKRCYSNLGFTLLQRAFPYLAKPQEMAEFEWFFKFASEESYEAQLQERAVNIYQDYMLENFFGKVLPWPQLSASCYGASNDYFFQNSAWYYNSEVDPYGSGPIEGENCGVGSWTLSPRDLALAFHRLFTSEDILTQASIDQILEVEEDQDSLGFELTTSSSETRINHGGAIYFGKDAVNPGNIQDFKSADPIRNTLLAQYTRFEEDNLDTLLVVNSNTQQSLESILVNAYHRSVFWNENPAEPYCFIEPPLENIFYINQVKLGSFEHDSFWSEGSYLYDQPQNGIELKKGESYQIEVGTSQSAVNDLFNQYNVVAWIDFDQNYKFFDNEKVLRSDKDIPLEGEHSTSAVLEVPKNIPSGETRLRVQVRDYKAAYINKDYACSPSTKGDEQFQAGEVEDYLVRIVE